MTEHDPPPPSGEIVGVIIGAVALFIVISFLPIAITWHRRRRRAATAAAAGGTSSTATAADPLRRDSALQALTGSPSMQQLPISVERWLEEQTHSGTNETWHYAQESCAICLERLKVDENEKFPTTTTNNLPPTQPKPAWIPQRGYHSGSGVLAPTNAVDSDLERGLGLESGLGDWRRGSVPLSLSSSSCSTELDAEQQQQQQQHAPTEKQPPQPHPQQDEVVVLNRCNHVFHAACLVLWVEQHRYRCPICQASLKHSSS